MARAALGWLDEDYLMKIVWAIPGLFAVLAGPILGAEPERFEYSEPHMGTNVRLVLYATDAETAKKVSKEAFARVAELERMMTDYDPNSELMRLCALSAEKAGAPVKVSPELFRVLWSGQEVARLSDGAFDMTVGPLVRLWRQSRRTQRLPSASDLAKAKARVGYRMLELNEKEQTVTLKTPGMQLDLGGIAKGYAADEMLKISQWRDIRSALAAVGGDIAVSDAPPGKMGWVIEVAPLTKQHPERTLRLSNMAVSTSGDKEQFVIIDGVRYSHIVDPRTGLGQTGQRSVTVIARHGITSDSMTKPVALLEAQKALELIEQTPDAATLIVVKTDKGEEVLESKRLSEYLVK
jgi:thiamine biosynthesis lipoprotein